MEYLSIAESLALPKILESACLLEKEDKHNLYTNRIRIYSMLGQQLFNMQCIFCMVNWLLSFCSFYQMVSDLLVSRLGQSTKTSNHSLGIISFHCYHRSLVCLCQTDVFVCVCVSNNYSTRLHHYHTHTHIQHSIVFAITAIVAFHIANYFSFCLHLKCVAQELL